MNYLYLLLGAIGLVVVVLGAIWLALRSSASSAASAGAAEANAAQAKVTGQVDTVAAEKADAIAQAAAGHLSDDGVVDRLRKHGI